MQRIINDFLIIENESDDIAVSATFNMEKDTELFSNLEVEPSNACLRFYTWPKTCVTYGFNQDLSEVKAISFGLGVPETVDFVRRPTGGGLVIHSPEDLTYSLVVPLRFFPADYSLLSIYYKISEQINRSLNSIGIYSELRRNSKQEFSDKRINPVCADFPAKYEIMLGDQKIVGSAQKKGKKVLLQQTQIFLNDYSREDLKNAIIKNITDSI